MLILKKTKRKEDVVLLNDLKKYDVVLVDFGLETIGSEQGGVRPSVIIQNDVGNHFSDTVIVLPFTKQIKKLNQPTHSLFRKGSEKGLLYDSVLLGECVRQVSKQRVKSLLGHINNDFERNEIKRVYMANM